MACAVKLQSILQDINRLGNGMVDMDFFDHRQKRLSTLLVAAVLLLLSVGGWIFSRLPQPTQPSLPPEASSIGSSAAPGSAKLTLYGVGDNLYHQSVIDDGKNKAGYLAYYRQIAGDIAGADIAFVNQETVIGGKKLGYSGYPIFNAPDEAGEALAELGFDVINHASNHVYDKGLAGVEGTLAFWKPYKDITVIGLYGSQEERDAVKVVERNGIKLAFLSYTYGLNGYKLPEDKPYLTNLLDPHLIVEDVRRAKELGDVLVVSLHWGNEYSFVPTAAQRNLAQTLADEGVDLILGHHPHVIQPVEWVEGKGGHRMLVYYSLGNLLHSMEVTDCMLGAAAEVEFGRQADGSVGITKAGVSPLINHYEEGKKGFVVYPLEQYTDALAARHGVKAFDRSMSIADMSKICRQVLGEWYKDERWKTLLVNHDNPLPSSYVVELASMDTLGKIPARANMQMDQRVVPELIEMFDGAKRDGVNLYLRSSYRSYALQKTYYDSQYQAWINAGKSPQEAKQKTLEYTAYPGTSEHHTGLAADIISVEWENTVQTLTESFADSEAGKWLMKNAHLYGFILRYPKGKEQLTLVNYEPWHYRYVGKEAAAEIHRRGICLEEYLAAK